MPSNGIFNPLDKVAFSFLVTLNINFHILAYILLCVGTTCGCMGMLPWKEDVMQMLAVLAPSSLTVGPLLKIPRPAKAGGKMIILRYFHKLANIYFSSENLTNMTATLSKKFNDLRD